MCPEMIFRIKEMQSLDIYCNKYNYPFDLWESQGFGPFDGNVVTVNSENQKFYNVKEGTKMDNHFCKRVPYCSRT